MSLIAVVVCVRARRERCSMVREDPSPSIRKQNVKAGCCKEEDPGEEASGREYLPGKFVKNAAMQALYAVIGP